MSLCVCNRRFWMRRVAWRKTKEDFELTVEVPEDAEAEVVVPFPAGGKASRLEVDGRLAPGPVAPRIGAGRHVIRAS